ncbi:DUF3179 domain-containing (seleno)protein [Sneathiella litorea]|uniref:DUF3179 domain-containing protein n=1 Tax=Sneathiella litorea TaxID=2606216 RepID=A0A6L8W8X7_9PROT|nr:DUF3179 domain-containing (seleno)protein [Sneathiella litorea]MZR31139.1 DUF3179 domain-containing protein [Sneathiella litorea]
MRQIFAIVFLAMFGPFIGALPANANPELWAKFWPQTDFSRSEVPFDEIRNGGVPKDGIPSIDNPRFIPVAEADHLTATEPVIGVVVNGEAKAYPLQVLIWHEIVNDEIGGVPVAVTFCPLCNASMVFDRRINHPEKGEILLEFGTTGKLRHSDLVMYDRQTESWWQQFVGRAIIGELTGTELEMLPVRIESFTKFKERQPSGLVLVPNEENFRRYGMNPYQQYDSAWQPFLYNGDLPDVVPPLSRVVVAEGRAWALDFLRQRTRIETPDGLILEWEKGQNSALDAAIIGEGVDIGNVTVRRRTDTGYKDILYTVDFAFAHHAFHPDQPIIFE